MSQLSSVEPETIRCPHSNCQIMQYDKPGRDHCIRCRRPLRVDVDAPEFELEPEPPEPEPPEDDLTRYLASELQEIRLVRGLSQQEAAEAMDVPRTYCTKIERARNLPRLSSLERFAKIYDFSLFRLFGGEEIDPPTDPFMDEVRGALPYLSAVQRRKLVATAKRMCGPFKASLHGRVRRAN